MSLVIKCDGCGETLRERQVALTGERVDGLISGLIPDSEFHLCRECAVAAFAALPAWRERLTKRDVGIKS